MNLASKRPWIQDPRGWNGILSQDGEDVCAVFGSGFAVQSSKACQNASLILTAVNNFEEMVDLLIAAQSALSRLPMCNEVSLEVDKIEDLLRRLTQDKP